VSPTRVGMFLGMSPDDPGVMGNLPRSRPGRRSSKREGASKTDAAKPAGAAKPAAAKSTAKKTTARRPAKRTSTSGAKSTRPKSPTASASRTRTRAQQKTAPPQSPPQEVRGSTDPVTGAVMLAGKVVESGLKVAGGIIKRLPRP
jgi:hypothetical protein